MIQIIQSELNEYKKGGKYEGMFPERWLPATVAILPYAFTADNKMLNATMKMVRGQVVEPIRQRTGFPLYSGIEKTLKTK